MCDPRMVDAQPFSLAIPNLHDELARLRRGSLYWLACARVEDADRLCRQVLAGMGASTRAALVAGGRAPQLLLLGLDACQGPGELASYSFAEHQAAAVLQDLPKELERALRPRGRLLLLSLPAQAWSGFDQRWLLQWCMRMRTWLAARDCSLLVLTHAGSARLYVRLQACSEYLAGLAQLYRQAGAIHYLVHFWRNELGVNGSSALELEEGTAGFAVCTQPGGPVLPAAGDQQLCLALRETLEGAPALSEHWQLFDEPQALLARAMCAQAASVLLTIASNDRVGELARQLYALRQHCGAAVKLVVRELEPCLRTPDEQVLLGCGANLVVPCGTRLPRFLTLLGTVQGQLWRGRLPADVEEFLCHRQPPSLRGVVPGGQFVTQVREILAHERSDEAPHLLLALSPVAGLSVAQILGQCRLRRYGDFACSAGGRLYLFLFGCPSEGLEMALGHVFRLPWRELFSDYEVLTGVDALWLDWPVGTVPGEAPTTAAPAPAPRSVAHDPVPAPRQAVLPNVLGAP
ncbi:cellulose biosynthesis protein BcsE [Azotobacter salinestris]|uniref:cellulose biosynthesis protein BcsE n=1 Tax=Azotobacter salinestris TaxID=69964 RepID=UPI0032DECF8F